MSLTPKEKELVSVGASIAAGCKLCTNYHFRQVRKAGASDGEIEQAISDAMRVRDSAARIMERHGLKLLGITRMLLGASEEKDGGDVRGSSGESTRISELVGIAAAFSVNCTSSLEKHLAAARSLGVAEDVIDSVLDLARFIKGRADSLCCKLI